MYRENTYQKEPQREYIQGQSNKIRNSYKQSWLVWQIINKMSGRKNT